jgi:hypothetical protein
MCPKVIIAFLWLLFGCSTRWVIVNVHKNVDCVWCDKDTVTEMRGIHIMKTSTACGKLGRVGDTIRCSGVK